MGSHSPQWGVSNTPPAVLEDILRICEQNGWQKPSAYQGDYNLVTRGMETKLLPTLRAHGMSFVAFRYVCPVPPVLNHYLGKLNIRISNKKDTGGGLPDREPGQQPARGHPYVRRQSAGRGRAEDIRGRGAAPGHEEVRRGGQGARRVEPGGCRALGCAPLGAGGWGCHHPRRQQGGAACGVRLSCPEGPPCVAVACTGWGALGRR